MPPVYLLLSENKPLSKLMIRKFNFMTPFCVTRDQWTNAMWYSWTPCDTTVYVQADLHCQRQWYPPFSAASNTAHNSSSSFLYQHRWMQNRMSHPLRCRLNCLKWEYNESNTYKVKTLQFNTSNLLCLYPKAVFLVVKCLEQRSLIQSVFDQDNGCTMH